MFDHLIRLLVWVADLRPPVFLVLTREPWEWLLEAVSSHKLPAQADGPDQKTRTG